MNEFLLALILSYMIGVLMRTILGKKFKDFYSLIIAFTLLLYHCFIKNLNTLNYSFILFILWYMIFYIIFDIIFEYSKY